jgi:hypothetical protein
MIHDCCSMWYESTGRWLWSQPVVLLPERRGTAPAGTKVGCQGRGGADRNEVRVSRFDMGPWVTKRKRLEVGNQDGSSRVLELSHENRDTETLKTRTITSAVVACMLFELRCMALCHFYDDVSSYMTMSLNFLFRQVNKLRTDVF